MGKMIYCYKGIWYGELKKKNEFWGTIEEVLAYTGESIDLLQKALKSKVHKSYMGKWYYEEIDLIEQFMLDSIKEHGNTVISPNRLKFTTLDEIINEFRLNGYEVSIRSVDDADGLYYVAETKEEIERKRGNYGRK